MLNTISATLFAESAKNNLSLSLSVRALPVAFFQAIESLLLEPLHTTMTSELLRTEVDGLLPLRVRLPDP